ncbi:MAG TPA: hypothetical protein VN932_05545 [Rhizomicrobium sp.]|nr:hypothetical protein [Rhizomicrobium sp.]
MRTSVKSGIGAAVLGAAMVTGVFIGQAVANQPHMENALASLIAARDQLAMAEHNKGGHRAEALRLTNAAIDETRAGMADAE